MGCHPGLSPWVITLGCRSLNHHPSGISSCRKAVRSPLRGSTRENWLLRRAEPTETVLAPAELAPKGGAELGAEEDP